MAGNTFNWCVFVSLPPSPLALIIGNGDVVTFVEDRQQGPKRGTKDTRLFLAVVFECCLL